MANSRIFHVCLAAMVTAPFAAAQSASDVLARMDQFARTFNGAQAKIRSTTHNQGLPDDVDSGLIFVKRSGGKSQFLIHFTDPNDYTAAIHDQTAEVYHPKIKEIQVYDLRAYKDVAEKLFLLGFGMPGSEVAGNYEIRTVKPESIDGQASTYLELIPKSAEVLKQLRSVELWISDANHCPVRQTFHLPDGSYRMAQFSDMQVNPKFPSGAFDLPKGAKRIKVN